MKAALLSMAALFLVNAAHAAPLTSEQVRAKVISIPEVKAVYSVYKGSGWSCQNTQVQLLDEGGAFEASKSCENSKPGREQSVYLTIKGFIYGSGSGSSFVVDSINFNRAG